METHDAKITIDLGDRMLVKRIRIAGIMHDRTMRDLVKEAIEEWLERHPIEQPRREA